MTSHFSSLSLLLLLTRKHITDFSYVISHLGRKFPGPVELVKHHAVHLDGFLTLARFPLDRPTGESPIVLQGVRSDELEEKLRLKAMEMGLKVSELFFLSIT